MIGDSFTCQNSRVFIEQRVTTDYLVVVGPGTAFPGATSISFDDIKDGLENTILVVECGDSGIHWMEPRDLDAATMSYIVNDPDRPSVASSHLSGPGVVFADNITTYRLQPSLRPETLRALTTIAGGEAIKRGDLIVDTKWGGRVLGENE